MFKFLKHYFSEFASTERLHKKFNFPRSEIRQPGLLSQNEFEFRFQFLTEELNEFKEAFENKDEVKMLDSLLDLVVVAHGTACFMGVSKELWRDSFDAVNLANSKKVRGSIDKRGFSQGYDLRKPIGWVSPDDKIAELFIEASVKWNDNFGEC